MFTAKLGFASCLLITLSLQSGDQPVRKLVAGRVVSSLGQPVASVTIHGGEGKCSPFRRETTKTDKDGRFTLPNPGKVLFVRHYDYRPISMVLGAEEAKVEITLPAHQTRWVIPQCEKRKEKGKRIGDHFRLLIPSGAKKKSGWDVDYQLHHVWMKKAERKKYLRYWWGPTVANTMDYEPELLNAVSWEERWIEAAGGWGWVGIEARGISKDGLKWRWTWFIGTELAEYEGSSEEEALFFDKIIDSACFVPFEKSKS